MKLKLVTEIYKVGTRRMPYKFGSSEYAHYDYVYVHYSYFKNFKFKKL